jgi:pimeloyl-ACP methyl ester carboxylesterase
MITSSYTLNLDGAGPVDVTVSEYGEGRPFLLLHGGGGPDTVARFGETLAAAEHVRVLIPVHPGFGGTPRPEALHSVRGLAAVYVALLDQLGLDDVTVIGNSIGGWIAAEIAILNSPRVSRAILIDAAGLEVPGHPVADFFSLTMDQVFELSFHNPAPFRIDPATLPPAAQAIAAGNRAALAVYAGTAMTDPTLGERLHAVAVPTLVVWGDSDRMVDPDYGRAFAAAIPKARFELLSGTGHMPQVETPGQLLEAIR